MEDLQEGDRFYYLTRTAGLNLLAALEGNSFAELVMRNSDAENLPADAFSRPGMTFDLRNTGNFCNVVADDPADAVQRVRPSSPSRLTARCGTWSVRWTMWSSAAPTSTIASGPILVTTPSMATTAMTGSRAEQVSTTSSAAPATTS